MKTEITFPQFLLIFCLCLLVLLVNGWMISTLWLWFIVPGFSVSPISVHTGCGIALIATYCQHRPDRSDGFESAMGRMFVALVIEPALMLVMALLAMAILAILGAI